MGLQMQQVKTCNKKFDLNLFKNKEHSVGNDAHWPKRPRILSKKLDKYLVYSHL